VKLKSKRSWQKDFQNWPGKRFCLPDEIIKHVPALWAIMGAKRIRTMTKRSVQWWESSHDHASTTKPAKQEMIGAT